MEKKVRESSSNEKMYKCPLCSIMIPAETRRLDICSECKQGSNFKPRHLSEFEKMFLKV